MIKNIKVDVVYFMTATDFEFEFNLGSCCHMRLLNGKASDRKGFVNALARAVSRSQIIICCGPLFGDEGLISTAATAISHGLQTVDNKAYGIASENEIKIIAGSVPLVTPEGYFGGCIIESGNQSIILLTENRTVRKAIMKTLIHPYIEDMSLIQSAEKSQAPAADNASRQEPEEAAPETQPAPETRPEAEPETVPEQTESEPEPEADVANKTPDTADEITPPDADTKEEQPGAVEEKEPEPEDGSVVPDSGEAEDDGPATEEAKKVPDAADDDAGDALHNIEFDYYDDTDEGDEAPSSDTGEEDTDDTSGSEFFMSEDEEKEVEESKINVPIIIVAAILLLAIIALSYFLIILPIKSGVSPVDYFRRIFDTTARIGVLR